VPVERVYRWDSALVAALALGLVGITLLDAVALLAALIPLAYVAAGTLTRVPEPPKLAIQRELTEGSPAPGEEVTVRLTVRNHGSTVLSDLRVIDAVPERLAVVEGAPRGAFALGIDDSATIEYTVTARLGTHQFGDPFVRLRTLSGTRRLTARASSEGEMRLDCHLHTVEIPTRDSSHPTTSDTSTETPGQGLEFYATREYHSSDGIRRINWRRYAKTGDLTTIQFREQRAATVMLLVDARPETRVTPSPGHPDGLELTTYVASRAYEKLTGIGHKVGLTCVGLNGSEVDAIVRTDELGSPWIDPSTSAETTARVHAVLQAILETDGRPATVNRSIDAQQRRQTKSSDRSLSTSGDRTDFTDRILGRLSADTHVVVCAPVIDSTLLSPIQRLRAAGHEVTLISPDITGGEGPGATLAGLERDIRLDEIRVAGASVIDWDPADPLSATLADAFAPSP
jgi:uncharacterized repeat protein (TIGR01451 family)